MCLCPTGWQSDLVIKGTGFQSNTQGSRLVLAVAPSFIDWPFCAGSYSSNIVFIKEDSGNILLCFPQVSGERIKKE